jgi:hypothetical protein
MILFKGLVLLRATIAHAKGLDKFGASEALIVIFFVETDQDF